MASVPAAKDVERHEPEVHAPEIQPAPPAAAVAQTQGIEQAPPAYTPQPPPTAEPQNAHITPVVGPPGPATALPTDLNTEQKGLPTTPGAAPGQPILGVVPLDKLGQSPEWIDCPFCKRRTLTRIDTEGTAMQVVAGVACCLLCVCLACIPCLAHWFEDTNYYCSQCGKKVAKRSDSGVVEVYGPEKAVPSQYA